MTNKPSETDLLAQMGTQVGSLLKGKMGIRTSAEGFSARFTWQQFEKGSELELWGILGQGRTRLVALGDELSAFDGAGNLIEQGPIEQVMRRHFGWFVPLAALADWTAGQPVISQPVQAKEYASQQLVSFQQFGWQVAYQTWTKSAQPKKMNLRREDVSVRLVFIDRDRVQTQNTPPN